MCGFFLHGVYKISSACLVHGVVRLTCVWWCKCVSCTFPYRIVYPPGRNVHAGCEQFGRSPRKVPQVLATMRAFSEPCNTKTPRRERKVEDRDHASYRPLFHHLRGYHCHELPTMDLTSQVSSVIQLSQRYKRTYRNVLHAMMRL